MSKVSELTAAAKREYGKAKKPNQNMQAMIRYIEQTVGVVESVKRNSLGLSERYFHKGIWRQKQDKPDEKFLKKAGVIPK